MDTQEQRPTPRTEGVLMAFDKGAYQQTKYVVPADFARALERENAELREALEELYTFPGVRERLAPTESLGSIAARVEHLLNRPHEH